MQHWIITTLLLLSWSTAAQARSVALDCAVPAGSAQSSALVERDMHSVTVETAHWVGTWHIQPQREQGFRAVLTSAAVKPGYSRNREEKMLTELETLAINMNGPDGGFRAGKRYNCAMSDRLLAGR